MILFNYLYNFFSSYLFLKSNLEIYNFETKLKNLDFILMILIFSCCLLATFKDPGIITPKSLIFSDDLEFDFPNQENKIKNEENSFYLLFN